MQLVNVLQGGKLVQDLDGGNLKHRKEEGTDKEHFIVIRKDTLLNNIAGSVSGHVNSAHHQAIDPNALGENLQVNAYDDDAEKIIEGLEFKDKTNKALCFAFNGTRKE